MRAPGHAVLATSLMLLLMPIGIFAGRSASDLHARAIGSNQGQGSQAGSGRATTAQAAPDPEPEEFSKAMREGRLVDAEKVVRAAIEEEESKSQSSQRLSDLLNQLGYVESQMGHLPKAVEAVQREMAIDRARDGPRSSSVMVDFAKLAQYEEMGGDFADAADAAEQELALARENPGQPDPRNLLRALQDAIRTDTVAHRTAQAQALREEIIQICQSQSNPELVVRPCGQVLSDFYRDGGHTGYAEETLSKQADETRVLRGDRGYMTKVLTLQTLAHQYEQDKSYDFEAATYRKAIAVVEASAKNPAEAAYLYDILGHALELAAQDEAAEAAYQHALDLLEHATGDSRSAYIGSLTDTPLADFYQRQGRLADAESVLNQVLAEQEKVLDPHDDRLAQTLLKLAQVKSAQGEFPEAEALAQRALAQEEANYGPDSPKLMPALMTCSELARQRREFEKAKALADRANRLNPYHYK